MTEKPRMEARTLHPIRASGTLALILLFLMIGLFMAFAFELADGADDPVILVVLAAATLGVFGLWVRENRISQRAANAPATPRREMKAALLIPLQAGIVMAYVAALLAAMRFVPELDGFFKGMLQSLPVGLVAGWVVVWIYIILESDEMIRRLMTTATAISAGGVLCAATFWALVTLHADLPAFDAIYLFPAFAALYGVVSAFLIQRQT